METLKTIYSDYREASLAARKKSSIIANFFNTSDSVQKSPCHEAFYYAAEKWVSEFLMTAPDSAQVLALGEFMLTEPRKYVEKDCYWFMYAAIGLLDPLIPRLEPQDAAALHALMGQLYRRSQRMPVQDKIYSALAKQAKA